jgi:hypothetical protein
MDWIGFLLRLRETRMPIGQMQAFARLRGEGNHADGGVRGIPGGAQGLGRCCKVFTADEGRRTA